MTVCDSSADPRLLAAALRWWEEMGVETLVEDTAQPWLGRASSAPEGPIAAPESTEKSRAQAVQPMQPAIVETPLPQTLPALLEWLAQDAFVPDAGPPERRITPFGSPQASLLIVTDMPEGEDFQAGHLLSGEVGHLFDKMLAAIGLDRTAIYCLPLCPGRPPTGQLSPSALPRLGEIARHHIALTGAKQVWSLGQATSRALLGTDATGKLDKINHNINHFRGITPCIASLHPRLLLQTPQRKAVVWKDMQLLIGGLN